MREEETCYYCQHSTACGYHQWYCNLKEESVSQQDTCNSFQYE